MLRQIEGRRWRFLQPAIALACARCWTETSDGVTLPVFYGASENHEDYDQPRIKH
jgi:hypothetical protein